MENPTEDMNTELVCVIASLGYHDEDDYYKGEDCLPSLKDLIRFLRHEDESCNIRRQMGHSQLLEKDLLPLFIYHGDDAELIDIVVRLLVNLTSPADICFNKRQEEAEEEHGKTKVTNTHQAKYLEVVSYLQAYKEAFVKEKAMAALAAQLGKILQMEWEDRGDDEFLLFERLLLLLRNILHVPSSPDDEKRTDDDASLHDQILWNLHLNGIDDLLVYICSSPDESRWAMHAIEIVHLMLREQNPEKLAKASEERSESEKKEDARALMLVKEKEEAVKKNSTKKVMNTRHSRFGGSFWVTNMQGVGKKNTLVHHKHIVDSKDISFDHKKYRARVPIRKREAKETFVERKSTPSIRLLLKEFSNKFLEDCYNSLMRQVKDNIASKRSQDNDETYYLWALKFFMAFNRVNSFKVEYVSETLNMNAFYYILKQINHYYDNFFMHKRGGWEPWQRRLHYGIQGYKELLTYISHMDSSHDTILKDASSVIKNNVFYHEEYRSIFLVLIRHYDSHKQTKKYLGDLIDTFHIFLKMLEKFCSNKGAVIIKTKKKKTTKRRKKKRPTQNVPQMSSEQLEALWEDEVAPSLSSILQGNESIPENLPAPFDPTSEVPDEDQKQAAMVKVQDLLRTSKHGHAIAIIRASREFWPDEETFGGNDISPEDEFMIIRNLLFKELERPAYMEAQEGQEDEEEEIGEEEEEVEESRVETVEREFSIKHFLTSLASPQIMIPYAYLLKCFQSNSTFTNHAIAKMMHRVAVELKFTEMFFQLSLFITFKEILDVECTQFKELAKFAKYITNKFITAASEKPNIFVETLFWKGTGDCYQISEREDDRPTASAKHREKWTFEDEEELKSLYEQYRDSDDVVGDILKSVTDKDRTRRQISNKLVRMRLVENARDLPRPRKAKANEWTEDQTDELHRLFEEFKETDDVLSNILTGITSGKSKNAVVAQLIATDKISDRSDLKKSKKKRRRKRKNGDFKDLVDELPAESDSDEGENGLDNFLESQRNLTGHHSNDDESDPDSDGVNTTHDDVNLDDLPPNASIGELVGKLKEIGLSQQIVWLQTRLQREMEGREEDEQDDWYATPLLTMTDEDEKAMKNKIFRKLLRKIGLKPPEDFNVATWWTIPPKLTPSNLRTVVAQIENPSSASTSNFNTASSSTQQTEGHVSSNSPEKSSSAKSPVKVKKIKKKIRGFVSDSDSEGDDDLVVDETKTSPIKPNSQRPKVTLDSSDSEDDTQEESHKSSGTKRRSAMLDSESEDDENGASQVKRTRLEDDEEESKITDATNNNVASMIKTNSIEQTADEELDSETLHEQSALNFSLRLSDEETIDR